MINVYNHVQMNMQLQLMVIFVIIHVIITNHLNNKRLVLNNVQKHMIIFINMILDMNVYKPVNNIHTLMNHLLYVHKQ